MPPEITQLLAGTSIFVVLAVCGGTVLSIALTIGITIFARRMINKTIGPNRGVLQNGIPAQAKIVSVRQTGVMLNNQPQILFDLEVQPPGGAPYRAQAKAVIPMVNIPQFQPGVQVSVKIHPSDPTQVVMDVYQ
ncbi:MAG: hypothetical protein GY832_24410 [Chloroflexi bacterium]|nr:hypothetical protein [Chloroflexota bacterium]